MSATAQTMIASAAASRARFQDPDNFFAFEWPPVPRRQFLAERDHAFAADTATGEVLLDASDAMGMGYPATTPLLLARYLVVREGAPLEVNRVASAEIIYVFHGKGSSEGCGETLEWGAGDVFCFPGGADVRHTAIEDALLFTVCNEPLLRLESLRPARAGKGLVKPVLWSDAAIAEHFRAVLDRPASAETAGRAIQLSSQQMEPAGYPVPTMNVAINTLEPGGDQRPHRHNGAAITLCIQGEGVYSMIEDEKVPWSHGAAQVTPATELHSHHNRGPARMRSLVVQDEGLHFYTRTPGFSWT